MDAIGINFSWYSSKSENDLDMSCEYDFVRQ